MNQIKLLAVALSLAIVPTFAAAKDEFPSKPVRFIVPNEPGGTTDVLIRALTPSLTKTFGEPVIVENRAGASATIGSALVARSAPDGYTLLVGSSAISSNAYILHNLPYDAETGLEAVSRIAVTPYFLIVNAQLDARNVGQLVSRAKANPGKLSYASSGTGTSPHISGARFAAAAGVSLLHVPYKGTAPALNDVLAGRVDMMFVGLPSAIGQIQGGRLRALAIASEKRLDSLPDVPTMKEAGLANFTAESWFGILAPKGTPDAVKAAIAKGLATAVNDAAVKSTFSRLGAVPVTETPAQAQNVFTQDLKFWKGVAAQFKGELE